MLTTREHMITLPFWESVSIMCLNISDLSFYQWAYSTGRFLLRDSSRETLFT